jgi:hypothetical protein
MPARVREVEFEPERRMKRGGRGFVDGLDPDADGAPLWHALLVFSVDGK